MTDTTDMAALRKRLQSAISQHEMMMGCVMGLSIVDPMYQQCLDALNDLEAERQRADALDSSETQLIEERDSAEAALSDMYEAATGHRPEWSNMFQFADAVEDVEAELAALKAKLANPVVLSDCNFEAVSHMAHWYSEGECVAWASGAEHVKKQIVAAGFSVRED